MRPKGEIITLLETLMVRHLSCLHLDHFVYENFALTEFFELVLVSGDEPRVYAFKNCSDLSLKEIENIIAFGKDLVERNRKMPKSGRRAAMVFLVFENGVSNDLVKRILKNGKSYKTYRYIPVIIDRQNKKVHYNIWKTPIFFLEIIWFIKKHLFSDKSKKEHKPAHIKEEYRTIEKIESFRFNLFNSRAYITWLLIAINITIWLLMEFQGDSKNSQILLQYGAKVGPLIWMGEFWRLITPVFIHIGVIHLISNCIIIYILGSILEAVIGRWRLLLIYLFSGLVGNLLSLRFSPYLSAGASSGVFGILGALITYGFLYKKSIPRNFYKVIVLYLLPFLFYNLAIGIWYSQTDNYAHLGGLLGGVFISYLLSVEYPTPVSKKVRWRYAVCLAMAFALLYMFCMEAYPKSYRVYYFIKGEISILENHPMESIGYLERSLEVDPQYEKTHLLLGKLYYQVGQTRFKEQRYDAALKYFLSSVKHLPLNRKYRRYLSDIYEKIGSCYSSRGEDLNALKYYRHSLLLNPRDLRLKKLLSNQYRVVARRCFEKFKYDEALSYAQKAVETDEKNFPARKLLGDILYRKGNVFEAGKTWKIGMDQLPDSSIFKNTINEKIFKSFWYPGNVVYKPGKIKQEAWDSNREGEKILAATGDFQLAQEKFKWAYTLDPSYAAPLNNLAKIELMLNNTKKAKYWVEKSLEHDPKYWEAMANKAVLMINENKIDRAKDILDECIKIQPEYADCYGIMGVLNSKEKNFRKAEEYFKKALSLTPENVPWRIEMAKTYYNMDDIRNFLIESNNGIGYADSQNREELSFLIRTLLKKNNK